MITQIIANIIITSSVYLLIALSFTISYYPSKFFHIAHAAIITIAAYFFYFITQQLRLPLWCAIPFSIFSSSLIGIFIELGIYKPLRKKNTSPLLMLIASLGLYVVLQNCISFLWGDDTKSIRSGEVSVGNEIFGAYIADIQILTIVLSISLFILAILFLKYHKIGKNIRAIASNLELVNIQGINSDKIILWSFCIGSIMAAIVGILIASDTGMTPTMGFNFLLYGIVAMIIGGIGYTWGLIGGALFLATAQHLTAYYIDSKWMNAITYMILILFLIWKPLGFSGQRLKKTEI